MYYEGLYILNIQGKEEGLKEAIELIEREVAHQGGRVYGIQKMDRRKFERQADKLDSGFYVNVQFTIDPAILLTLQNRLKLNEVVYRQFYIVKDSEPAPVKEEAAAPAAA
ncbi:MAG: 30S ribosomal protein S6 [Candidatus Methylacidiphilales bacterium]